ncbi:c-type cytochrome biogenesis protein CcmI [Shimia sp.]|uniref:c-type cytochrome biogenesis protein CcmI n=1 Tax=Shimia sp. TaxID=1954381 RepID=UPI003562B520
MLFWIIAVVIALAVLGLLTRALLMGRSGEEPPAAYDLRVYRDQLKEVDRDLARGVIAAADAERVRTEVSRRILAADAQLQSGGDSGGQPRAGATALMALMALVVLGGGLGLYWVLGAPGYGDLPLQARIAASKELHASRASQAEFEAKLPAPAPLNPENEYTALVLKLRDKVAGRPDDLQGNRLLARTEANLGNDRAAYAAQREVLRLLDEKATAQDHIFYAELMISATQGYVSPEAEAALTAAMKLAPRHPVARYYWGLMLIQNDRPDLAFQIWEELLYEGPAEAPWLIPIRARIEELAWLAGVDFRMPAAAETPAGPTPEDLEAAGQMSAEEQQEMIRGMVASLAERLDDEGGSAEEWARLIGAYGTMGDSAEAASAWDRAQRVFDGDGAALAVLRAAAAQAGLVQ